LKKINSKADIDREPTPFEEGKPSLEKISGKLVLKIPRALIDVENELGCLLVTLIHLTDVDLWLYDGQTPEIEEASVLGKVLPSLVAGFLSNRVQKLTQGAQYSKLGVSLAFAVKLLGHFETSAHLGLKALKVNHYFFGNGGKACSDQQTCLGNLFKSGLSMHQEIYYNIVMSLGKRIALFGFDDHSSVEKGFIKGFDETLASHFQMLTTTKTVGKGKKKEETVESKARKCHKPGKSPLFTKSEQEVILKVLDPLWCNLDDLKASWYTRVQEKGFPELDRFLAITMQQRYAIMARFAAKTTRRLQGVRKDSKQPELKKSAVSRDELINYLHKRPDVARSLLEEIRDIIDCDADLYSLFGHASGSLVTSHQGILSWITARLQPDFGVSYEWQYTAEQLDGVRRCISNAEKASSILGRLLSVENEMMKFLQTHHRDKTRRSGFAAAAPLSCELSAKVEDTYRVLSDSSLPWPEMDLVYRTQALWGSDHVRAAFCKRFDALSRLCFEASANFAGPNIQGTAIVGRKEGPIREPVSEIIPTPLSALPVRVTQVELQLSEVSTLSERDSPVPKADIADDPLPQPQRVSSSGAPSRKDATKKTRMRLF
jgi:hypothetical protein